MGKKLLGAVLKSAYYLSIKLKKEVNSSLICLFPSHFTRREEESKFLSYDITSVFSPILLVPQL